jgi:hypothetical protein
MADKAALHALEQRQDGWVVEGSGVNPDRLLLGVSKVRIGTYPSLVLSEHSVVADLVWMGLLPLLLAASVKSLYVDAGRHGAACVGPGLRRPPACPNETVQPRSPLYSLLMRRSVPPK